MSNDLLKRLLAVRSDDIDTLQDSAYFQERDIIPTNIEEINLAFSGSLKHGGVQSGVTFIAGPSKSFKSLIALICLAAYLKKYPDAIALFYDTEFGTTPAYMAALGIDNKRVVHIPIEHIEELKFDMAQRLKEIKRGDHVFIFVDSLGLLPSKKEVEDAENEKSVADMTRAKQIRSLLRIITSPINKRMIPCFVVNHVYQEMALYPKTIMSGGTAPMLAADQVWFMSRSNEKEGAGDAKVLTGYNFTIKIEKSRTVREGSRIPITVKFEGGVQRYSGLLDIAIEMGFVTKEKDGRSTGYSRTGLDKTKVWSAEDAMTEAFWKDIIERTNFDEELGKRYKIASDKLVKFEEVAE